MAIRLSIRSKLTLALLLVIFLTVTVSVALTLRLLMAFIEQEVERELNHASRSLQLVLELQQNMARTDATALALRPDIQRNLAKADREALIRITGLIMREQGLDYVVVTDNQGTVLARAHAPNRYGDDLSLPTAFDWPLHGRAIATMAQTPTQPVVAVGGAPVFELFPPNHLIGAVVTGYALDQAFVAELKATVGADVSLIVDGNRLYTTLTAAGVVDPRVLAADPSPDQALLGEVESAGQTYLAAYSPLLGLDDGRRLGTFEVAQSKAATEATVIRSLTIVLIGAGIVSLISLGLALGLASLLTRPMARLTRAARALGDGDFSRRVAVHSGDELETLGRAFNQMAANIEASQAELAASEQRFRSFIDHVPDTIYVLDLATGNPLYFNRESFCGYSRAELEAPGSITAAIHPADRAAVAQRWQQLLAGAEDSPEAVEYRLQRKDGTWEWVSSREIILAHDAEGRPSQVLVTLTLVTERKRAEEALIRYTERLEGLQEIGRAILAADSAEEIADAALRRMRQLIPCQRAAVALFDLKRLEATVIADSIDGDTRFGRGTTLPLDGLLLNVDLLRGGELYQVEDYQAIPDPPVLVQALQSEGLRSSLGIPLNAGGELIGLLGLGRQEPGRFEPDQLEIIREVANQLAIALENARLLEHERAAHEQLHNLAGYLQAAREEERAYIAREVHDEFGQALTALKIDLSWISKRLPEGEADLKRKAGIMSDLIDTTIQMVQRIAAELRPGLLDDLGLTAALEWQVQDFSERTGIGYDLNLGEEELVLESDLSTTLFRIFQETMTNVARHAQASRVWVRLQEKPGELRLTIRDNGRGISEGEIDDPASLGLIGIRERARSWGGEVAILGAPGQGTTVTVRVPQTSTREPRND
jgi:PAS domain S-box-containing protein